MWPKNGTPSPYPLASSRDASAKTAQAPGASIAAVLVGFVDFPTPTIIWTIWTIVYQQIENDVIQPRIQLRAVDAQPFVVLVAVLFGCTLFGVVGALLAVPLAATIQIVISEILRYRKCEARLGGETEALHPRLDSREQPPGTTVR